MARPRKSAGKGKGGPGRAKSKSSLVRPSRDYAAEYKRRMARAKALKLSKTVARGHPKPQELGREETRQLRRAATTVASPGEQRRIGVRPRQAPVRVGARERIAEVAKVRLPEVETRSRGAKRFVKEAMRQLGIGAHQAWTLWFSP